MVRTFDDLISLAFSRERFSRPARFCSPARASFRRTICSLEDGDAITMEATGIGTLTNPVVKKK